MRLIDADKLIEVLRNSHKSHAENSREESLLARDIRLVQEQAKYHSITDKLLPLLDPDNDPELALERIREVVYSDLHTNNEIREANL